MDRATRCFGGKTDESANGFCNGVKNSRICPFSEATSSSVGSKLGGRISGLHTFIFSLVQHVLGQENAGLRRSLPGRRPRDSVYLRSKTKMNFLGEFSGGPVIRTLHFHCCGPEFNPLSENYDASGEAKANKQNDPPGSPHLSPSCPKTHYPTLAPADN